MILKLDERALCLRPASGIGVAVIATWLTSELPEAVFALRLITELGQFKYNNIFSI